jgi:hypothetical protein
MKPTKMTPEQKLKRHILERHGYTGELTAENVDSTFERIDEDYCLQDATEEIRQSGMESGLKCECSRHYESKAVAAKMSDGTWVGWTYWYGGGKYGEPEAIEWMTDAVELNCEEKQVMVTQYTFSIK